MNDNKIKCMYFSKKFKEKPINQIGWVQNSLTETEITLEELADALAHGATFRPAVLQGGRKSDHWAQQQIFGLDFDDGISIEDAYNKVMSLGIKPCFMYTSFSHTEEHHKFRMAFCNDTVITDKPLRDRLQATLMGVIGGIDKVCFNRDRLFFGGKDGTVLYPDYDSRINADDIIDRYWNETYQEYIPNGKDITKKNVNTIKETSTKITSKVKNNSETTVSDCNVNDNTDAISTLNVSLLQERLGLVGDIYDTDRRIYSLLVSHLSLGDTPVKNIENGKYQFLSEAELYNFINSIDLAEYLGVPDGGSFNCILPTHRDSKPSAYIYTTDDGTQIYKCFGCGQARTIISITEQLSHCRRSEAINFIKQVYGIDYKPTEWVERQRQLMIDSALYLDSDEFKQTFPKINKLIRTRKTDIQKILFHMTKYVNDELQYEGKPLFFSSLNTLMKVCERSNKNIMSQTITLFTLLNMLNKVELECIPEVELNKAKSISAKYGFKKIVNFYQVEEYGFTTLEDSEEIAKTLIENNVSLQGLSREYVLRTFGVEFTDRVFPQYKHENRQGTSEKSDNLTNEISAYILDTINQQGYILEKDVNIQGAIGRQ